MTPEVHHDVQAKDPDELRNEILLAYIEASQTGSPPDLESFLSAHEELRDELEEFLQTHAQMEQLAAEVRGSCDPIVANSDDTTRGTKLERLGDFRLVREIGRGGMGVVYEAEQISLQRRVALKLLPFAATLDGRHLQRFKNEALAAAHVRHEHIVPVFAVGEDRGVHYYVMQYIEGYSLSAVIAQRRAQIDCGSADAAATVVAKNRTAVSETEGVLPLRFSTGRPYHEWVARLGHQAASALEYAHSVGIVHRDIKPANLLLDERDQIWVTDFGLAQMQGDAGLTLTGEMVGTIRYASPEQLLGRQGLVDQRTDVYSLGATLYELLTSKPVFDGVDRNELVTQITRDEPRSLRSRDPSIPRELETIILKALSKDPAGRYLTARDLADDLNRYLQQHPIQARRPGLPDRMIRLAWRHPSIAVAGIVSLVLLTAGSLVSTILIQQEQQRTKAEQQKVEQAYVRERQRAEEAESRFRLARRSVDEIFRICQEDLAGQPGLEALRKRLLSSVLVYYQEFIDQRRDNPQDRAELVDAMQQVASILSELAALRTATQLYLLNQDVVVADLQLTEVQQPKVKEFCRQVGNEWVASLRDLGHITAREQNRKSIERATRYQFELKKLLTTDQQKRLAQIGLQAEGLTAFGQPEVIEALRLTDGQRQQIRSIDEESLVCWMRTGGGLPSNSPGATRGADSPMVRALKILSPDQVIKWRKMTGDLLDPLTITFPALSVPHLPTDSP